MDLPNPLRRPRPDAKDCLFVGKFLPANKHGAYERGSMSSFRVHVTRECVWLSDELAIPIPLIRRIESIETGFIAPCRALAIAFDNPLTGQSEVVRLCKLDPIGIGIYQEKPLDELRKAIETAQASPAPASDVVKPIFSDPVVRRCESCGRDPAYYVEYCYLVGLLVAHISRSGQGRVHCRRHLLWHGLLCYLATSLFGWPGISILVYPVFVIRCAWTLRPAVGFMWFLLALVPLASVGGLVWYLISLRG